MIGINEEVFIRYQHRDWLLTVFNAGFAPLSFLSHLIPEYIKIDRSAILSADASEVFRKFLSDLIKTLRNYTKKGIIAEGAETDQELAVMRDLGISLVQGLLFDRPRKADELIKNRELSSKS